MGHEPRGAAMKPKTKILFLLLGSLLPAAVMYFVLRSQEPLPIWFPYFCLTYLAGQHILVRVVGRRMIRGDRGTDGKFPFL